jgi:hypothetical protein
VSDTSSASVDGWKAETMGEKKPKEYTFTKYAGPKFNLLPHAKSTDIFFFQLWYFE